MDEWILRNEMLLRLGFFLGVFSLMAFWEGAVPRRRLAFVKSRRWFGNLTLALLNSVLLRIVFPSTAVGMARFAGAHDWGLLNNVELPYPLAVGASLLVLDLAIYLQHVLFHAVPALWRLHRVHHADLDFDVTTGSRFHPLEMLLSMGIKLAVVAAVGPPVLAALAFEVLLNATSLFNHGNVRLPLALDRALRWWVVTPDMHRVHHSVASLEANSNFGFNLPWWDRLLGTYRDQPERGHEQMTIGVKNFQDPRLVSFPWWMLVLPFMGSSGDYPVGRRQARAA